MNGESSPQLNLGPDYRYGATRKGCLVESYQKSWGSFYIKDPGQGILCNVFLQLIQ